MEVKNRALRSRVFIAALALGLILGAQGFFSSMTASQTNEDLDRPGAASGLGPGVAPGKSPPVTSIPVVGQAPYDKSTSNSLASHTDLEIAVTQSKIRMNYLEHCQKAANCVGFDDSQPYSYDLQVRQQTAREIDDYAALITQWQDEHGGGFPEDADRIARYFLETGNDDVKEAAIKLISLAPLSEENVEAAFHALETSASGPLMAVLMKSPLAGACMDSSYTQMCRRFIAHTMRIGGENVRKTFARYSLNMTSPETLPLLAKWEQSESPRSTNRLYLRLNREEFERMEHGG